MTSEQVPESPRIDVPGDRDRLLAALRELVGDSDYEIAHGRADDLLIAYINDEEIEAVWHQIGKWYA